MRLAHLGSPDLRDILGHAEGDREIESGFAGRLSPSTDVEVFQLAPRGWSATLDALRLQASTEAERFEVLITSAAAELVDPSQESREALIELVRWVRESRGAHVVVLNCSSLLSAAGPDRPAGSSEGEPLDLRIRRLNLAIIEASNATGLSVLDADRLVAETRLPTKVVGPFRYAPEIREVLRSSLASILGELGFAQRAVMEARLPFVGRFIGLSLDRWLTSEGDAVATGDVMCELRLTGFKKLNRPTSAVVLASIDGSGHGLRRMVRQERIGRRRVEARISLVACENAVLRKVVRQVGEDLHSGDVLAVLSGDAEAPVDDPMASAALFRTSLRSDDPSVEALL